MADPLQIGTFVGACTSVLVAIAAFLKANTHAASSATSSTAQSAVVYDREVERLRADVVSIRDSASTLRVDVERVKGETETLRSRTDKCENEVSGLLSREHVEADARGKLRSRVEHLVGLLQAQRQKGGDDD